MDNTANVKHCLEGGLATKCCDQLQSVAQLCKKPAGAACLPKYRHARAAVHKLFSIRTAFEWIDTDKRCLNFVPEICFDSCPLYCLPPGLSFNYMRLTPCFLCHTSLIAEGTNSGMGWTDSAFLTAVTQCLLLPTWITHFPQSFMIRKRNGPSEQWFRKLACALYDIVVQQPRHF